MAETKTKYLELEGEFHWAKIFEENRDLKGPDGVWADEGGRYTIDVILNEKEYKELQSTGSLKEGKETDDGRYRVQLTRPHIHDKYPQYGGPPKIARANGTTWLPIEDGYVGNGSTGVVYLAVYPAGKRYYGTRLNAVQVINLVPFSGKGGSLFRDRSQEVDPDFLPPEKEEEEDQVEGTKEDLDDEIPF